MLYGQGAYCVGVVGRVAKELDYCPQGELQGLWTILYCTAVVYFIPLYQKWTQLYRTPMYR